MGTMTTMLVSFAELSNIFSILAVLICFCAMILFITRNMMVLRIHGEELVFPAAATLQHHHTGGPRIPQMNMMKVHIPFTFRLVETSKSSYAGTYLALTGSRLSGYDVLLSGIATHYVSSKNFPDLEKALLKCKNDSDIQSTLNKFSKTETTEFSLKPVIDQIDKCFNGNTVEDIVKNLQTDNSDWAKKMIVLLNQMSPTSMKLTKACCDKGAKMTLPEVLKMEYNVAWNVLEHVDFYEGVRAQLIDKDKKPTWNPPTLEEVTTLIIDDHFKPASPELDLNFRTVVL